jgi:hypothetical protein
MQQILKNIALVNLTEYCTVNNIDCSGTYIYKIPYQFRYALCKTETNQPIITITYYKNRIPLINPIIN